MEIKKAIPNFMLICFDSTIILLSENLLVIILSILDL
jgi:hypothetical protein